MTNKTAIELSSLNTLLSLQVLKKLGDGLNFDFTALEDLIVNSSQDTQTLIALLNTEIEELKTLVQNQQPSSGLIFTPLALLPTYQIYTNNTWIVEPQNLQSLYDNDQTTASNLFQAGGNSWAYGEVIMMPGVSIPSFNKIEFKVGLRNSAGLRSLFELAAFNISLASFVGIWSFFGTLSQTQDLIANINAIVPFSWDKLRWRMYDVGEWNPQARFYDLKVWEVS